MTETLAIAEANKADKTSELAIDIEPYSTTTPTSSPSKGSSSDWSVNDHTLHGVFGERLSDRASDIMELYKQHELGKAILGFAIPVSTGLLSISGKESPLTVTLVVVSLCVGFAAIWNGLLLRGLSQGVAFRLEQFGVVFVLAAFFGLVSTFVPVFLIWAPWACWALSLVPFALTLF